MAKQQRGAGVDLDDMPILFRPRLGQVTCARNLCQQMVLDPEERALVYVMIGLATRDQIKPKYRRLLDAPSEGTTAGKSSTIAPGANGVDAALP